MPRRNNNKKRNKRRSLKSKQYDLLLPLRKPKKKETESLFVIDKEGNVDKKTKYRNKLLTSHKVLGISNLPVEKKISKTFKSQLNREVKKLLRNEEEIQAVEINKKNKKNKQNGVANYDLWGDDTSSTSAKIKKPNEIKAVPVPDSQLSYNPSFESHQQALANTLVQTIKKDKEKWSLDAKLRVPKELRNSKDPNKDERVTQIQRDLNNPQVNVEDDDDEEQGTQNDPIKKVTRRVTEKKRRQKKRKALKKLAKIREKLKKTSLPVEKVLPTKESVEKTLEHQRLIVKMRRMKKDEERKTETTKVGPNKLEEEVDYEAVLTSDQLTGSIRTIPKHKNLIFNTFVNMQKRNLLEPRVRTEKKRARTTRVNIYSKKREWNDLEKELTKNVSDI